MTVCMFPGQGSQAKGMGRELFDRFAEATATADAILGYSVRELCLEDPRRELSNTRFTQPALFVVNALAWRARCEGGAEAPAFLMGHSLGEYNALEAAGALSFEDALRLVQKRGALMAEAPPGAMAAVIGLAEPAVRETLAAEGLEALDVANLNGPEQIILSGLKPDIERAAEVFDAAGARYVPLNTSGAFHSRYMAEAREAFAAFLAEVTLSAPTIPVISNVEARPYPADGVAALLAAQITSPVRWAEGVRFALAAGAGDFVELGPGQVLTRLVAEIRKSAPAAPAPVAPAPVAPAPTPVAAAEAPKAPEAPEAYDREAELAAVQRRIEAWNRAHPVGTRVAVEGYPGPLATRSQATVLFGHRAAIYLEGYNGYFELGEVRPA